MRRGVAILLAITLILSLTVNTRAYMNQDKFKWLLEKKIVEGRDDGNLSLESTITRAEMAKIIVVSKSKLGNIIHKIMGKKTFTDVNRNTWYYSFVEKAFINGYITGRGDGKFYPKDNITIKEVLAIVERAINHVKDLKWPDGYINYANENKLLKGVKGDINKPATRHDAFLILLNAISKETGLVVINDDEDEEAMTKAELPKGLNRIGAAGDKSSFYLYALAPEKLVGWDYNFLEADKNYAKEEFINMAPWGMEVSIDTKKLFEKAKAEAIIFIGSEENYNSSKDYYEEGSKANSYYLNGDYKNIIENFKKLGDALGETERANRIIDYIKRVNEVFDKANEKNEELTYYYGLQDGLISKSNISAFNELNFKDKLDGAKVSKEKLTKLDVDIIFLENEKLFNNVKEDENFKDLRAVKENKVYLIPKLGLNWMRPFDDYNILGRLLLSRIKAPEVISEAELKAYIIEYYELFMHYGMSNIEAESILKEIFKYQ